MLCYSAVGPSFGQNNRSDNQETVVGNEILFTKVAGKGNFGHAASELGNSERASDKGQSQCKPGAVRLCLSRGAVDSIEKNVERYKEFLQQRSHHTESRFNPWTAVEQYVSMHLLHRLFYSCTSVAVRQLFSVLYSLHIHRVTVT